MLEEEYQLEYFRSQGLARKICSRCGAAFWTRDPERETCGDAPCEPYGFIGNPVFKPHTLDEMREAFLSFFERHGHTRMGRYPVVARWRDDIYLTIASIADFQPYVTGGHVPPPANPLTISQPCIRLNDLDAVGRSGRHMTLFEMMAHHAFNTPEEEVYWKDETVSYCDEFLASIGADLWNVSYKEHPWVGGGNAGPSLEVLISGLEVATLVFMNLGRAPTGEPPVVLEGESYYPIRLRIVDTGYGLERFVWASQGTPTIYDAVFPDMVGQILADASLGGRTTDREYARILGMNARYAGMMDIRGSNLAVLRQRVADSVGVTVQELQRLIEPIEKVYTIADHSRCLAYMLGDCIVPSNVREGYLARLVLRRTLRLMMELGMHMELADLVEMQIRKAGADTFEQSLPVIREIVDGEVERYRQTLERGRRIVQKLSSTYRRKGESVPVKELILLYDSHGIPPEMVREIAGQEGGSIDLPDNFYSMIASLHSKAEKEAEKDAFEQYRRKVANLPPTRLLYYEQPGDTEFEADVVDFFDGFAVLDQTLFYPEGGGQPSDTGLIITPSSVLRVESAARVGEVILHEVRGGTLRAGDRVKGKIDEDRRRSLMRHHTATHILLRACKDVLGNHVHQAGAQKGSESSRLDIRHFKHIAPEELQKIEILANRMVMEDTLVSVRWEERTKAEQKYGFDLYQGGVPPGRDIRVVRVNRDVEACAGTHCRSTGEVGPIKIIRVEHIQDGIERLEFAAGEAAIYHMQQLENLLASAAGVISVQPDKLPAAVQRFFGEWKEQRKEIERLQRRVAELERTQMLPESFGTVKVFIKRIDTSPRELVSLATGIADEGGIAILASADGNVHVVVASGVEQVDAASIVQEICTIIGGKGGGSRRMAQGSGPQADLLDRAFERGRFLIQTALS
ncbi:MAG: alanine--tRNA ligase [Methanomicrobiales archaeon]|nr:alanine--tRNA ligase [Methanomicrobiales archaeon]